MGAGGRGGHFVERGKVRSALKGRDRGERVCGRCVVVCGVGPEVRFFYNCVRLPLDLFALFVG